MNEDLPEQPIIMKEYVKDLEEKLRETLVNLEKQQRINVRIINNYESLDQKYDRLYCLLTEEQRRSLKD
tara:strand:- start:1725 stop:1931 length:207 start_codon:yes stop_codon:yes gene_type:complete